MSKRLEKLITLYLIILIFKSIFIFKTVEIEESLFDLNSTVDQTELRILGIKIN